MAQSPEQQPLAVYEQPLNERIRTLLRLQFLFSQIEIGAAGADEWSSRQAVAGLLEMLAMLAARADLRAEMVKELDRLAAALSRLEGTPGVDQTMLSRLLQRCREQSSAMQTARALPGSDLKDDELLNSVAQRAGVPGGSCGFDLPAYQHWLNRPAEQRQQMFQHWMRPLANLRSATETVLGLLRDSANLRRKETTGGVYQQNLEPQANVQLIRVALPADAPYFAEISGSKHFFTVRFMTQSDTSLRPVPLDADVEFRIALCGF